MRKVIGWVLAVIVGLYDLAFSLGYLNTMYGFPGVVAGIVIFPISALVPLYTLFVYGWLVPALIIYGGGIIAGLLLQEKKVVVAE